MTVYIALLRGINVGGKHIIPMHRLRNIFATLSCQDIATYIQSGNVVFRSDAGKRSLQVRIGAAIKHKFGFVPRVLLLTAKDLRSILAANPFPAAVDTPSRLHIWFFEAAAVNPDIAALDALRAAKERFVLTSNAFYLHAPNGIGRSRLAARVEQSLGVEATARNWRTVSKLAALAATIGT